MFKQLFRIPACQQSKNVLNPRGRPISIHFPARYKQCLLGTVTPDIERSLHIYDRKRRGRVSALHILLSTLFHPPPQVGRSVVAKAQSLISTCSAVFRPTFDPPSFLCSMCGIR